MGADDLLFLLFLIPACTSIHEPVHEQVQSQETRRFTSLSQKLTRVEWLRTPEDAVIAPKPGEQFVWVGQLFDMSVRLKMLPDIVRIEYLCQHLYFANPGPESISMRPIKAIHDGKGYFLVVLDVKMPIEVARELEEEQLRWRPYLLVGGTFDSVVEIQGKEAAFIVIEEFELDEQLIEFVD